jgi:phosphoenolpyruvate carboxykinase (ATP)
VQETGVHNGAFGADKFGLKKLKRVHWNLGAPQLYQYSLAAGEAELSADGALCADTGDFTGHPAFWGPFALIGEGAARPD